MPTVSIYGKGRSSKLLARALGTRRNVRSDIVIRYGKVDNRFTHEINSASAIKLASNKFRSLQVMKEAGVAVPRFSRNLSDLTKDRFSGIILARDDYHSKGADIVVLTYERGELVSVNPDTEDMTDGMFELPDKDYYIQYLKPRAEYRYHVAFGKVILCTKKVLAEGEEDDGSIIRNHQDGKWAQVTCAITERFAETCVKAVEAHGLDFGAVDFLNVNREAVVLEVNTAPGLQVENRLTAYSEAFKAYLGERYGCRFTERR